MIDHKYSWIIADDNKYNITIDGADDDEITITN